MNLLTRRVLPCYGDLPTKEHTVTRTEAIYHSIRSRALAAAQAEAALTPGREDEADRCAREHAEARVLAEAAAAIAGITVQAV